MPSSDHCGSVSGQREWQGRSTMRGFSQSCLTIFAANLLPTELLYNTGVCRKLVVAGASGGNADRFFGRQVDLELLIERVHRGSTKAIGGLRRMRSSTGLRLATASLFWPPTRRRWRIRIRLRPASGLVGKTPLRALLARCRSGDSRHVGTDLNAADEVQSRLPAGRISD